jgi:hypothetical protein
LRPSLFLFCKRPNFQVVGFVENVLVRQVLWRGDLSARSNALFAKAPLKVRATMPHTRQIGSRRKEDGNDIYDR